MLWMSMNALQDYVADLLVNGLWKYKKRDETAVDCI